ncbi:MAG: co-chaperone GroES family protein, partial [Cyclobacteriaceae bacterium]|nr:co-chaperone GroES family protein [Cyclobacteriaceae bacterium]
MTITAGNKLKKLIVVGDRVLIRPAKESEKTESGLYLPPGVQEKEKIQKGYINVVSLRIFIAVCSSWSMLFLVYVFSDFFYSA